MAQEAEGKRVSVVVPCYKSEAYLPKCLDSLVAQTMDDYEVICVNDGSPDGCERIMREYADRYPNLVRCVSRENGGLWNARWSGIDVARGEYVGFLDSDDWVDPTFVRDLFEAARRNDADIAVCGFRRTDLASGRVISDEMGQPRQDILLEDDPGMLLGVNSAAWNKLYRASILRDMHRLSKPPSTLEDVMFNLLAYLESQGRVTFTGTSPVHYMVHADSMINTMTLSQLDEVKACLLEIRDDYLGDEADQDMMRMLDATAFLHVGVAMSTRLAATPGVAIGKVVGETTDYLDRNFPTWRHSPYLSHAYARGTGSSGIRRLAIAHDFWLAHLMTPFLAAYNLVTARLGIDIKW